MRENTDAREKKCREALILKTMRHREHIGNENPATLSQMTYNWAWLLLLLFSLVSIGMCLPTSLMEDMKKADQAMKPKCKTQSPIPYLPSRSLEIAFELSFDFDSL